MTEIINIADEFCTAVQLALEDTAPLEEPEAGEIRLKLGLCRNLIAYARGLDDQGVDNPMARDTLKRLVTAMMWVAYYSRGRVKYKVYRKLVIVESLFTEILARQIPNYSRNGGVRRA